MLFGVHRLSGVSQTLLVTAFTASCDTTLAKEKGIQLELEELMHCVFAISCRGFVCSDLRSAVGGRTIAGVAMGVLFFVIL